MSTFTLVQPRALRRRWELRRGGEVRAAFRMPLFRSRARAEAARRPLSIERQSLLRSEYFVRDDLTGEVVAQLRADVLGFLTFRGKTLNWRVFYDGARGFVNEAGEPLVTVKATSGIFRTNGEVRVSPAVGESDRLVISLVAAFLFMSQKERETALGRGAYVSRPR
jgi:hypothetical protein